MKERKKSLLPGITIFLRTLTNKALSALLFKVSPQASERRLNVVVQEEEDASTDFSREKKFKLRSTFCPWKGWQKNLIFFLLQNATRGFFNVKNDSFSPFQAEISHSHLNILILPFSIFTNWFFTLSSLASLSGGSELGGRVSREAISQSLGGEKSCWRIYFRAINIKW